MLAVRHQLGQSFIVLGILPFFSLPGNFLHPEQNGRPVGLLLGKKRDRFHVNPNGMSVFMYKPQLAQILLPQRETAH
ncbi:hypothetical protein D3C75_917520 [compost metagenome]